jgi:hypothetical protein
MSELKTKKGGLQGLNSPMALLNLRWQQMRWELLQEIPTRVSQHPQERIIPQELEGLVNKLTL